VVLLVVLSPEYSRSQALSEPKRHEPIPREGYASWSLFLICNPAWLLQENQAKLQDLYRQFRAFGRAIGPKHLAVWFWERSPGGATPALGEYVDVDRSSQYCDSLRLLPSQSPHVVVMTTYPAPAQPFTGDKVVLQLNGLLLVVK